MKNSGIYFRAAMIWLGSKVLKASDQILKSTNNILSIINKIAKPTTATIIARIKDNIIDEKFAFRPYS